MSVTFPKGFQASGSSVGIKDGGRLDAALLVTEDLEPVVATATFTTNLAAASPVRLSRQNLVKTSGMAVGVLMTSGNANAANGKKGDSDALSSLLTLGSELKVNPELLLVASTGLIGIPMPIERLIAGIPKCVSSLGNDSESAYGAAKAIMTTDTYAKTAEFEVDGVRFGSIAKGAAMIAPNMATMLALITTDAVVTHEVLSDALRRSVDKTFNRITIDGCTSTNDTVFALASGKSGKVLEISQLQMALDMVCSSLARQIIFDAEGATKMVEIVVTGAKSEDDALAIARKVAESSLVKCSFYGDDPYFGRILSEVGTAGVDLDIDKVSITYGSVLVFADGNEVEYDREAAVEVVSRREFSIYIDVDEGTSEGAIITADLTHAYIDENMGTS
ncbi:MAG: bifunctional glutamate N-acetyltransferase/amino-acid acetyltransferase ArgJ [Actinomycetota bacterium]|nr:bifunctional glutamate N-acetyltransferase/amino-acid acetyltransferase ArgJ [Actinomycetota bacterium]